MYKINFNHLYYFLTIANEGSIVKAAKKLHITQPALSHQLKLLEEDFGKKLFDRKGRKLVLNEHGISVREYANKIFRFSEEMIQSLKSDHSDYIKIVKIGILPWISKQLVFKIVKPLISQPHIQIEFVQYDLEKMLKDLISKDIDIILGDSPFSGRTKALQSHRLNLEPIVCVASANQAKLIKAKGKFPKSLNNTKLLNLTQKSFFSDKIDQYINKHSLSVIRNSQFEDLDLLKAFLLRGKWISFLPKSSVEKELKSKDLINLGELPVLKSSLWAITHKDFSNDSSLAKIIRRG